MEWIHRRSLPHWYVPGAAHFVTYRVAGSLPAKVLEKLRQRKAALLEQPHDSKPVDRGRINKLLFAEFEKQLDNAAKHIDWLANPKIASMLRSNSYHHDGSKYKLHAYCIMPNHVHVLLTPNPSEGTAFEADALHPIGEVPDGESPLSKITHSLKSYTANEANKVLRRSGTFWQAESYDHWVRDEDELERVVNYVRGNPITAGLADRHQDWFWSSCHDRFLHDGDTSGWLY